MDMVDQFFGLVLLLKLVQTDLSLLGSDGLEILDHFSENGFE
jgi:hypothetical protein